MNTNVDHAEIAKFTALADEWWDTNGKLKTLHDLNPARLEFLQQKRSLKGLKVLDLGCGGGILTEALEKTGAEITAIDLDEAAITVAKNHKKNKSIDYRHCDVKTLSEELPGYFDVIVCMEMLEHVPDPKDIIRLSKILLKSGGDAYFSTLNRNAKSYTMAIIGAEYLLNLLPKGTHNYGKFIKPSELLTWAKEFNYVPEKISGIHYNPFTRKTTLSNDVSINYIVHLSI